MPKAGSTETLVFRRTNAGGAPVTGKVEADFTFDAWHKGAAHVLTTANFAELTSGFFRIDITYPATIGRLRIDITCSNPTSDVTDPDTLEGQVTANDIDSAAVLAARPPSVSLAQNISPQSAFGISVFDGDGLTLRIPVYDQDGELVDLSLWENLRFSIQNAGQTAVGTDLPYNQTTGITGGADGFAVVELPEDCSAYNVHAAGRAETKLYWSLDGNLITDGNTKTRTLRAGPFVIKPKETPSP